MGFHAGCIDRIAGSTDTFFHHLVGFRIETVALEFTAQDIHGPIIEETFEKRPLLPNLGVRLKF
jgi:hypothetical protein